MATINATKPRRVSIKASRDVAMATAAKAKLLLRELKTVKADLAFAKQRCSHLEEENKRLRDNLEKGSNNPADDDLIRLQLETLLAEKARLVHENSIYARELRENRFLREIVEYHQLPEVNPSITRTLSLASFAASNLLVIRILDKELLCPLKECAVVIQHATEESS
ncbi:unnamed protein product [Brassica oleracea var. botrytis]|uniref:Uncharacterized protein n=1 Tax=Brassica oleracea TaxID=3712 RepID=A0A3P6EA02_BRAOL|nr:unnamed protein product [Brassica oleracea]